MSWLLIVILVILVLSVIQGLRKGLIRTIVSTFFLVFVMAISIWLVPYVEELLDKNTKLPEYIEEKCETFLADSLGTVSGSPAPDGNGEAQGDESQKIFEEEQIEKLPLPDYLKDKILDNNTESTYQNLVVNTFADYVSKYLSGLILYIISFMIAFVLSVIILQIIMKAVDLVTELPLIGLANRLGGAAAGVVRALLWVWVFFAVLTIFGNTGWGSICMAEISKDPILDYLYTHNLLLELILG